MGDMTAAHFIFIPAVLLVGIIVGWILGSRAAQDAFAAELRRRDERQNKKFDPGITATRENEGLPAAGPSVRPSRAVRSKNSG
jgi:hypothetical protein